MPGDGQLRSAIAAATVPPGALILPSRQVLNLMHAPYNADGTGSGTAAAVRRDSLALVVARQHAIQLGGAVIYGPRGIYDYDCDTYGPFMVPENTVIEGDGVDISVFRKKFGCNNDVFGWGSIAVIALEANYVADSGARWCSFDGNRANTTAILTSVLAFCQYAQRVSWESVEFRNSQFFGVSIRFTVDGEFKDIRTKWHNRDGFSFAEGAYRNVVNNLLSRETGDDGFAWNATLTGDCAYNVLTGYVSYRSGMNTDALGNQGGSGIKCSGQSHHNVVRGAVIRQSADASLSVIPSSDNTLPFRNDFDFLSIDPGQRAASTNKNHFSLSHISHCTVRGKGYTSVSDGGVLSNACTDVTIDFESIESGGYGLKADGSGGDILRLNIKGKYFKSQFSGILLSKVRNPTISVEAMNNNQSASGVESDSAGIALTDCTNVIIGEGRSSDDQGGGATQRAGVTLYGTAVSGLSISSAFRMEGNTVSPLRPVTVPTGEVQLFGTGSMGPDNMSNDRGDANVTLISASDSLTQRFATALTANRTVTLSGTNGFNGSRFRVSRPAGGAFNLDVGGLKTLAAAQWCIVEMDPSLTWRLVEFGGL